MASSDGRRTAMESACSRSRIDASCHTLPRPQRRKVSMPSRRCTKLRDAAAAWEVDAGRMMLKTVMTRGRFYSASVTPDAEVAMTTWKELFDPGDATDFFDPRPPQPFNHESVAFDSVNAWWLAELSRLVYRDN